MNVKSVFVFLIPMVAGLGECRSEENPAERIVWHANLKRGLALAKQTNRPIFLVSGAPSLGPCMVTWVAGSTSRFRAETCC